MDMPLFLDFFHNVNLYFLFLVTKKQNTTTEAHKDWWIKQMNLWNKHAMPVSLTLQYSAKARASLAEKKMNDIHSLRQYTTDLDLVAADRF